MTNASATPPDITNIITEACARGMTVTTCNSGDYKERKAVHNARLDSDPLVIVTCRDAQDVSFWMQSLEGIDISISVRSGGHHHEGMCSNDDGVVLVMQPDIPLKIIGDFAWIAPGRKLGEIIDELASHGRMMPTGGCGSVNVGGLTNGGGWGMSYRNKGLTVDALREVEMVLPDGEIVSFDKEKFTKGHTDLATAKDLFWAIRGGGGGNFGVVTRFKFELYDPGPVFTTFALQYGKPSRHEAALAWMELCRSADHRLNTFARMSVADGDAIELRRPAFSIIGVFYGPQADCAEALKPVLAKEPFSISIEPHEFGTQDSYQRAMFLSAGGEGPRDNATGELLPLQAYALQVGALSADGPKSTCKTPEPHKISSAIVEDGCDEAVLTAAEAYIDAHQDKADTNMYLSLHGMGGCGADTTQNVDAAFPWRGKAYMLQVQAWWIKDSPKVKKCEILDWVCGFRKKLADTGHVEGAFINFPDRKQKIRLYYGGSWDELYRIKKQVDEDNRLGFEMGILGPRQ